MNSSQFLFKSKLGSLYLLASDDGLHGIFWKKQKAPLLKNLNHKNKQTKILLETIKQLEEYFDGKRKRFNLPLAFGRAATPFQKKVWSTLASIPYGKTLAYRDIAKKIKNNKAVRAVGTANGKNPFCIIIPCHRVIAADGTLGGYSGGLSFKRQLLKLEGVQLLES